jgi:hypothetical protein
MFVCVNLVPVEITVNTTFVMLLVSHATLDCDRLPVFEG